MSYDPVSNQLTQYNKVLESARYATDLVFDKDSKVLKLHSWTTLPWPLGRIVSYFRYKVLNPTDTLNQLRGSKNDHTNSLKNALTEWVVRSDLNADTLKRLLNYQEYLEVFCSKVNLLFPDSHLQTEIFTQKLSDRCRHMIDGDVELAQAVADSNAGKFIDSARLNRYQRLITITERVSSIAQRGFYLQSNTLKKLIDQQTNSQKIETDLASLECLKDEPNKLVALKETVIASLTQPVPCLWNKGHLSQADRAAFPNFLQRLCNNGIFTDPIHIAKFNLVKRLEDRLSATSTPTLPELQAHIDQFKQTGGPYKEGGWYLSEQGVPCHRSIDRLRQAIWTAISTAEFATYYPTLHAEWSEFTTNIPQFPTLSREDQLFIVSQLTNSQLREIFENKPQFRSLAEEVLCRKMPKIYGEMLKRIQKQLENNPDVIVKAVYAKITDFIAEAQKMPVPTKLDAVLTYLKQQSEKLSAEVAALAPELIQTLKLPCVESLVTSDEYPDAEAITLAEDAHNTCEIHTGLSRSLALSIYKKMMADSNLINWKQLPGNVSVQYLVETLAQFDVIAAVNILALMPCKTNEEIEALAQAAERFIDAHKKRFAESDAELFKEIPPSAQKDKLIMFLFMHAKFDASCAWEHKAATALIEQMSDPLMRHRAKAQYAYINYSLSHEKRYLDEIRGYEDPSKSVLLHQIALQSSEEQQKYIGKAIGICELSVDERIKIAGEITDQRIKDSTMISLVSEVAGRFGGLLRVQDVGTITQLLENISEGTAESERLQPFILRKFLSTEQAKMAIRKMVEPFKAQSMKDFVLQYLNEADIVDFARGISDPVLKDDALIALLNRGKHHEALQLILILDGITDRVKCSRAVLDYLNSQYQHIGLPTHVLEYIGHPDMKKAAEKLIDFKEKEKEKQKSV